MCRTCDIRNDAVQKHPATPVLLDVCLITLHFKTAISTVSPAYVALNAALNDITDAAESTSHPSVFTTWYVSLTYRTLRYRKW
jgi:hypothetical protein